MAAAVVVGAAGAALQPVATSGSSTMIGSFGVEPVTFQAVRARTVVSLRTSRRTQITLTYAKAGKLWWGMGRALERNDAVKVGWAGRSSKGLGVARPGVYDARLVVRSLEQPGKVFTATWQVQVTK